MAEPFEMSLAETALTMLMSCCLPCCLPSALLAQTVHPCPPQYLRLLPVPPPPLPVPVPAAPSPLALDAVSSLPFPFHSCH